MLLTQYALKFRTAVFMLIVVLVVMGLISYLTLPREGAPDITIPYVFIVAAYEGVAPEEMENLITIPLERQLNDLENVDEIRSTSAEGVVTVAIKFTPRQDMDTALQKVKNKIDLARPDLPQDLDEPSVQAFNFSTDYPILRFALSGAELPRLKVLADDLKELIEDVPGVRQAVVYGTREREIRVEIDRARLQAYQLPLEQVTRQLAQENRTVSAGDLNLAGGKFQVRVPGEFKLAAEMRHLVVAVRAGRPVYLADVATVSDTFKDVSSISRVNGRDCVSVSVKKRSGENSVPVIRAVRRILDTTPLPPGVQVTIVMDQGQYIRDMVQELENNIFSGFVLVVAILLLFMGLRNAILVGLAIPMSLLLSFVWLSLYGLTLNMIVLFSLVMAVGMLVDNAIVIVENIYRHRSEGLSQLESATRGASEVAWPVTTSTLTTVAAFAPLLFWPDIMGQFMSFLPKTLMITILSSLFVALVINPVICTVFVQPGRKIAARHGERQSGYQRFVAAYERVLRAALANRLKVLLLGFLVLILSVQAYARYGRGVELFPDVQPRSATVALKYPEGTPIEKTDAAARRIEGLLAGYRDVKFFLATVGSTGDEFESGGGTPHVAGIYVEFLDARERQGDSMKLVETMRRDIGRLPGAEVKVDREREGPPGGAAISIEVAGDDFETLALLTGEIRRRIRDVPGLADLQDDFEEARPELQFRVDRQRAALLGLDTDRIGAFLRAAIYGEEATKYRAGQDEYDITIRLPERQRAGAGLLRQAFLPLPGGPTVPLSSLGKVVYSGGRGAINRKDRKRVITLTGDNQGGRGVDQVLKDIRARLGDLRLPPGYRITYAGDNKDMQESGIFLMKAFGVAVGLIAVILVIEFNSVLLPVIIMVSIFLAQIGVMWGLLLCRLRFGVIMTGLGIISLAGVVVNNSIVLVDCMLQQRRAGMAPLESLVAAGRLRLRPVLLTAITTVLGLVPMAVGWSVEIHHWPPRMVAGAESSTWWAPMAVAVIFGLTVATVLTLIQVPVMCSLADSVAGRIRRLWARRAD